MPTPSLLIVPARFKSGKLYSQLPTSGAGDFTVTRATAATRVNASGFIESVASGIPRLDYFASGGTVGCPALLVEPAATNLVLRSEEFNVSGTWTPISGGTGLLPVITANAVVAPDGTTTADTIVFDRNAVSGTANFSQIQQVINLATSGTYTFSVYAKATAAGDVGKQFYIRAKNNLVSGTLTSSWVRYTSTETGVAAGNTTVMIGNRGGFTADQSVSVDLWGAQLETGSVATSYIPTTTGSVTRNADVVSVSGAVSGSIGQTEGTIYAEVDVRNIVATKAITQIDDGTLLNRIVLFIGTSPNQIGLTVVSGGSSTLISGSISTGLHKIAASYSSGSVQMYMDGSFLVSGTPTQFPANLFNNISVGSRISSGVYGLQFNDRIRALALYTTRLTNAELQSLTSP